MIRILADGSILDPIYNAIGWLLAAFYSVIPNLGVAIILLTFTIMLILYPLTAKQAKSMMAMQRVQPEIKKLQAKYKNDRQKLNEEMMKFYQENKINPLAGCLPLLVQLPIFFSLFRVLRDAYKHVPKDSKLYDALCHGFGKACGADVGKVLHEKFPAFPVDTKLVHHLHFLGMDLQKSAVDAHQGFGDALPYFLLVGLVVLTGFLQTRQAQKRTPVANKQMGMVMRVLPVFFGLISLNFPAGLVLYFFVSNLWRLGQQEVIFRRHGTAANPKDRSAIDVASREKALPEVEEDDEPPDDSGPKPILPAKQAKAPQPSAPKSAPSSTAAPQPAAAAAGAAAPARGLRGLFQLPPPPTGNGGSAIPPVPKGGVSPRPKTGGGAAPNRTTPPGSRSKSNNKKKRKR